MTLHGHHSTLPHPQTGWLRKLVAIRMWVRRVALYKPWLTGLAGFASAVMLAGIGILVFQDYDQYKGQLSEGFRLVTGRTLEVKGDIRMRIGLSPTLIMERVTLSNAAWGSRKNMASFQRFEAKVALLPLLHGELRIKRLNLSDGEIFLERNAQGKRNWEFETEAVPEGANKADADSLDSVIVPASATAEKAAPLSFDSIRVRKAKVTYLDRIARIRQRVIINRMEAMRPRRGTGLHVDLAGAYEGRALKIKGRIGAEFYTESMPYAAPVDLAVNLGSTKLTAMGLVGLPFDDEKTNLQFTIEGPRLGATLAALHVHTDDARPYRIVGRLSVAKGRWIFDDLASEIGRLVASGRITVARVADGSPVIADVHTPLLDFGGAPRRRGGKSAKARKKARWVFGNDTLPHGDLPDMNIRLALRADQIKVGGLTFKNTKLSARLDSNVLLIRKIRSELLGGRVRGGIVLNATRRPFRTAARLSFRNIDFGAMLRRLDMTDTITGRGDMSAQVSGKGGTWRQLAKTMSGKFEVALGRGKVSGSYVDMLGADLLTSIAPWATSIKDASLNCLVTQFFVKRGIATTRGLLFDTKRVTVAGKGTIDLRREKFDMKLMPRPKDPSLLSLAVPINLTGRLNDPSLSPDELSIAKNVAGAVAGGLINPLIILVPFVDPGAGEQNSCIAALKKGRGKSGKRQMPEYDERPFILRMMDDVGTEILDLFGE